MKFTWKHIAVFTFVLFALIANLFVGVGEYSNAQSNDAQDAKSEYSLMSYDSLADLYAEIVNGQAQGAIHLFSRNITSYGVAGALILSLSLAKNESFELHSGNSRTLFGNVDYSGKSQILHYIYALRRIRI